MVKLQTRTSFVCRECGADSPRWAGRCPQCDQWNTMEEVALRSPRLGSMASQLVSKPPRELSTLGEEEISRIRLPFDEFNRVLGGGIVPGSLVLIGGEPGIGKSTLLLQSVAPLADDHNPILFVSGEESEQQIRLRASRLGIQGAGLYIHAANSLDTIIPHMDRLSPRLVIIDSIQTVYLEDSPSSPGTVGQIREATWRLMEWSKSTMIPVCITGHVTKEGTIAGPRLLEHMVDVVLYLEGEPYSPYRLLRTVKNRHGSTNEVGILEMGDKGLRDVADPSRALLSERLPGMVGSAILPTLEGTRPLLVEVQALTSLTSFSLPRRTANGVDLNRLLLVSAILTKRLGLVLSNQDLILNVVGGLRIREPAADLAMALAIVSSLKNAPIDPGLVAMGELGLSGEVRSVSQLERRLREAAKMGFQRGIIPKPAARGLPALKGLEVVEVSLLSEAVKVALPGQGRRPSRPRGPAEGE
ncbi:MAG: DNA repair protein RadA [Dehalococcoidia bacterium]